MNAQSLRRALDYSFNAYNPVIYSCGLTKYYLSHGKIDKIKTANGKLIIDIATLYYLTLNAYA